MSKERNEFNIIENRESLTRAVETADGVRLASGVLAGIFGFVSLSSLGAGVATGVMSQADMKEITQAIYETYEYQTWVHDKSYELLMECVAGNITLDEYNVAVNELLSDEGVFVYMQTLNDPKINETIEKFKKEDDLSSRYIKNGFGIMGGFTLAAGAIMSIADGIKKKKKEELKLAESGYEKN